MVAQQSSTPPQVARKWDRIVVDIPVTVTSVLESQNGSIVDLSEHGLQITGCYLPKGAQFQVEYEGQTLWGVVAWSEFDRFGARLAIPMFDGPLYEKLKEARASSSVSRAGYTPEPNAAPSPLVRPQVGGFGRRRA